MSDEMKNLETIRTKLIKAKKDRDILLGKSEAAFEELNKLGYNSIQKASEALVKIQDEADKASTAIDDLIDVFYEKYPELVD